jgi:putative transcriptional regulator
MKKVNAVHAGSMLIAEPFMLDPYFRRSVILLCEHEEESSLGFIINKQLDIKVSDLIQDMPDFDQFVYYGGPVQTDTLHYIHNVGELLEDSVAIAPGIFWGGSFEKLRFLIDKQLILPDNIRFYVGYSGWTEGQLEDELQYGSWIIESGDANYVFRFKPDQVWQSVLEQKGSVYSVIAQVPESLTLN